MPKDEQGRGHEIKYAFYISDKEYPNEKDAEEFLNDTFRTLFFGRWEKLTYERGKFKAVVDWDGPL